MVNVTHKLVLCSSERNRIHKLPGYLPISFSIEKLKFRNPLVPTHRSELGALKDCLRACQEQIESLLESSLRQAQQHNVSSETKTVEDEADLSCTPTDVRDVNI
ncbi:UNVERIFIED_CONTAM: hypothetical protein H355_002061 [Colinus virginianus]|nr:hypothetical protein H355_002061 [Colinus virginianus]